MIPKAPHYSTCSTTYAGEYSYQYYRIIPTGRWKIVYGPESEDATLYIEHKENFSTRWIIEDEIVFLIPKTEFINNCK